MYVRRLELVDFRSYARVLVDFEPGPAVLVGPNGVGKTNLVEALGYLATLSSHRVATDAPLVRTTAQRAVVRAEIVHSGRELVVELQIEPGKANKARLGRAPTTRPRDILGALKLVLFARFASRQDESYAAKVNAALRNQFGGHAVERETAK